MRWLAVVLCVSLAPVAWAKKTLPVYAEVYEQATAAQEAPRDVPEPASSEPLAWEVGQWAVYKNTDANGRVTYHRSSIVGHDECGWWAEIVNSSGTTGSILKVCYSVPPWPRPDTTEGIVRVVETQHGAGKKGVFDLRVEADAREAARIDEQFEGAFRPATYDDTVSPGTIRVDSGVFAGCRGVKVEAKVNGEVVKGTGWTHASVPIFGAVKTEISGIVTEIVDYGVPAQAAPAAPATDEPATEPAETAPTETPAPQ